MCGWGEEYICFSSIPSCSAPGVDLGGGMGRAAGKRHQKQSQGRWRAQESRKQFLVSQPGGGILVHLEDLGKDWNEPHSC